MISFLKYAKLMKDVRESDMIQKMVDTLVNKQLKNHTMKDEEQKIYRYGYILLCEVFLNSVMALIIGMVFGELKAVIFFLVAFIPLRSFCGGWHANKIWVCTIISNVILLVQIYGIRNIIDVMSVTDMLIIYFFNLICVFLIAPVETQMKKISLCEKQLYKRKIKIILLTHLIIMSIIIYLGDKEFIFSMMYVYFIQNVMLLLEITKSFLKT